MSQGIPDGEPVVLTHRQWVILQQLTSLTLDALDRDDMAWAESAGPVPTAQEIVELSSVVGTMQRKGKPGTPKTVRCPDCQDNPGVNGLGQKCRKCNGQGEYVRGVW